MNRFTLTIALIAAAGLAHAADPSLSTVTVEDSSISIDCTPPNAQAECAKLHALIRANFTQREIGMLFGAATAYPEYGTSYQRVKDRYARMLHDAGTDRSPAVAAK